MKRVSFSYLGTSGEFTVRHSSEDVVELEIMDARHTNKRRAGVLLNRKKLAALAKALCQLSNGVEFSLVEVGEANRVTHSTKGIAL